MGSIGICPCCGRQIQGEVISNTTSDEMKAGIKFGVKTGSKLALGGGATTTGAAIGAAVGSIIPVVGTYIGAAVGGAVAHYAADIALDAAYDAVANELCPGDYGYYCDSCDMYWTSQDHDDIQIIIWNYQRKYQDRCLSLPEEPTYSFNPLVDILIPIGIGAGIGFIPLLFSMMFNLLALMAYLFTFTLWDPTSTTQGWIESSKTILFYGIGIGAIGGIVYCIFHYYEEEKRYADACAQYKKSYSETVEYNNELAKSLNEELKDLLESKGVSGLSISVN